MSDEDRPTVRIVQLVDPHQTEHSLPPVLERYHNERSLALLNVQITGLDSFIRVHLYYSESDVASDGFIDNPI